MADESGARHSATYGVCDASGRASTRAVYPEIPQVVHGIADGNPRTGDRTLRAEALAIGRT